MSYRLPEWNEKDLDQILTIPDNKLKGMSKAYAERIDFLEREFKDKTAFNRYDMTFLFIAAALQVFRWVLISNDSFRFNDDKTPSELLRKVGQSTSGYIPATITDVLMDQTVPYDAVKRSAKFKAKYPEFSTGVSGANHRYTTLGHDPLFGLIVGTANIVTNTLCVNKVVSLDPIPSYHVVNQEIDGKTDIGHIMKWTGNALTDNPELVFRSFLKQIAHAGTDVFTKQGLPLPIINSISPEASKFIIGHQIDLYSVTRGAALAMTINKIVEMAHKLICDYEGDDLRLYEAKTLKIIMYSNILSSGLNLGYVATTQDYKKLDVGGIAVALFKLLTSPAKIREIKNEFIEKVLSDEYKKEEDKINEELAKYGYHI